jgi:hypothetical protein
MLGRRAATVRRGEVVQLHDKVLGPDAAAARHDKGWVVDGKLLDSQPGGRRLERKHSARRDATEERRTTDHLDERVDVLDLALHRVWLGVSALTAPAPVLVDDGEATGQQARQLRRPGPGPVAEESADQDDGLAVADFVVGDRSAIR